MRPPPVPPETGSTASRTRLRLPQPRPPPSLSVDLRDFSSGVTNPSLCRTLRGKVRRVELRLPHGLVDFPQLANLELGRTEPPRERGRLPTGADLSQGGGQDLRVVEGEA